MRPIAPAPRAPSAFPSTSPSETGPSTSDPFTTDLSTTGPSTALRPAGIRAATSPALPAGSFRPGVFHRSPGAATRWRRGAMRVAGLVLLVVLAAVPRAAAQDLQRAVQGPDADWRTLRTEHFRVHYPADSEAWARRAASRMESIRERVVDEVGWAPPEVLDVVVSDPVAAANGFVLPLLGGPRMVLWTSPPGADSVIGHYADWAELLVVHEDVHVVHLLRPSRNPWRRALAALVPLGPVTGAPRWVSEGYATLLEGRLTGAGRPHSDLRAAILRRWAQAGKLPDYGRLASDDDRYLGMSMAYLAGSAYLEWLEERAGEEALGDLWARLTARRARSFDAAFEGVFGDSPADLWDRFTAEATWRALEIEERVGDGWVEGEPWLDLEWATGAPAVSPDGTLLALVLRHRDDPPELAVYSTAVDREAVETRREERRRLVERDPEDVPAVEGAPPPRRRLHTLPTLDGAPPSQPRWLPTAPGEPPALLLVRFLPDAAGFLHPDLFRWTPERGELVRLTRGADLRDADPAPVAAGAWAVAVRTRHGLSQLVRVELEGPETGSVTPLTEPALEVVYDAPRISPDGRRLAYVRHADGAWGLVLRTLEEGGRRLGAEERLPLPSRATVASPAWAPAPGAPGSGISDLFAVVGSGGFIDVYRYRRSGDDVWQPHRVTRSRGGAFAPAPAVLPPPEPGPVSKPTGSAEPTAPKPAETALYFLSLEPDGLDLRRLAWTADGPEPGVGELAAVPGSGPPVDPFAPPVDPAGLAPVVRPPAPSPPPPFATAELPPAVPYGLGPHQELLALGGGAVGAAGYSAEAGLRSGDLLGRVELIATGAWGGEGGAQGGALTAAWRRLPVDLSLHLVSAREQPSRQDGVRFGDVPPGVEPEAGELDLERRGAEVAASWSRLLDGGPLRLGGGVYLGTAEPRVDPPGRPAPSGAPGPGREVDESSLFAAASWHPGGSRGRAAWRLDLHGRVDAGDTDGEGWTRWRGRAAAQAALGDHVLALEWDLGEVDGDAVEAVPVPGPPGSPGDGGGERRTVAAPWQLFQVGGLPSSLWPSTVAAGRLPVPALPAAALVGDRVEAQRVEVSPGFLPLPLFWSRHRVELAGVESEWRSLAGIEWHGSLGPVPLLRLPEIHLTFGAAQLLDGPRDGEIEGWGSLIWRP